MTTGSRQATAITRPEGFPRRVLLVVAGTTPQIVTETLYALVTTRHPPFVPTEIVIVTTLVGRDGSPERPTTGCRPTLLDENRGQLYALCEQHRSLGLSRELAAGTRIRVIRGADGEELSDIRSDADSVAAANFITGVVAELTGDPESAVHASLAGGRKTMGFMLGYALSLFGRQQDRLSHVLVDPPFESCVQFFFPNRPERTLECAGTPVSTDSARITLADVPFVRHRRGLPLTDLMEGQLTFEDAVRLAQTAYREPRLEIDLQAGSARCGGVPLRLQPVNLAWLTWLASRRRAGLGPLWSSKAEPAQAGAFLAVYRRVLHGDEMSARLERAEMELSSHGLTPEFIRERNSHVNKAIVRALGQSFAEPYRICRIGCRPRSGYEMRLDPENISIDGMDRE